MKPADLGTERSSVRVSDDDEHARDDVRAAASGWTGARPLVRPPLDNVRVTAVAANADPHQSRDPDYNIEASFGEQASALDLDALTHR